MVKLNTII